ncbi:unnamed protein product [Brassica oleracea var. botrytis]|uniref:Uncharacterized protein n=1 Tax=Brassica oleracea TaxID=3712 RepID=A0A3P6DRP8_BRAOL|nr:unnamed protein product [Brassica oleracea]
MEEERRSEEETSHHRPFQFLNEAIKSFMECLGLHISPPPYYSASSVTYYKFISKEAKENQVFQKEFYLLFYIDMTKLDVQSISNKEFTNACRRLQTASRQQGE